MAWAVGIPVSERHYGTEDFLKKKKADQDRRKSERERERERGGRE